MRITNKNNSFKIFNYDRLKIGKLTQGCVLKWGKMLLLWSWSECDKC